MFYLHPYHCLLKSKPNNQYFQSMLLRTEKALMTMSRTD
jgi:hypothetical protein